MRKDINALKVQLGDVYSTLGVDMEAAARNKKKNKTALEALGITGNEIDRAFKRAEENTAALLSYVDEQNKQNR